jgi:hypothetical protein
MIRIQSRFSAYRTSADHRVAPRSRTKTGSLAGGRARQHPAFATMPTEWEGPKPLTPDSIGASAARQGIFLPGERMVG